MIEMPGWLFVVVIVVSVLWVVIDFSKDMLKELEIKNSLKKEQELLDAIDKESLESASMESLIAEDTNETAQDV